MRLAAQRVIGMPPASPTVLLELAALPAFELTRPNRLEAIDQVTELLLETVTA